MNLRELARLKERHPIAVSVWYDRMHQLDQGQLIETLLTMMPANKLQAYLSQIDNEIREEEQYDNG